MPKKNMFTADDWDDLQQELYTPEEIAASDLRVALIGELIRARQEQGFSQKKLEELSGVKQPIIARMEKVSAITQIDTVLKVLAPLGKTLAIVSMAEKKTAQGAV
jgi:predicted XRE-type DNA-binding protein